MSTTEGQQRCPRCQFPLEQGVSVCPQCGLSLSASQAPSADLSAFSQTSPAKAVTLQAPVESLAGAEAANIPADWSASSQVPASGIFPPPASPFPPAQVKPRRGRKIALIVVAIALVLILGTGGSLAYILTRPKPVIQVQSSYHVGTALVGSASTSFHITGQDFSGNANITFLVDGKSAPGAQAVRSDSNGAIQADLTVTSDWAVGKHAITAKDDQGYITKVGIPVQIVAQGVAGTPGPKGAPADNASFTLPATVQPKDAKTGEQLSTFQANLIVTGQPDPAGGTVCQAGDDDQPQSDTFPISGTSLTYKVTATFTCTGTYQGGKLSYTETLTSLQVTVTNGDSCTSGKISLPFEQFDGSFTSASQANGTFSQTGVAIGCRSGSIFEFSLQETGTWTGTK